MLTFGSDNIYRRIFRYAQQLVQISRHNSLLELLLCVFIYKSPIFLKLFVPVGTILLMLQNVDIYLWPSQTVCVAKN